ncbi:MAG: signal peptidase I [Acidobacteria bacterium]|nr:signal peptidase I [Acidobacteriota bacterium]
MGRAKTTDRHAKRRLSQRQTANRRERPDAGKRDGKRESPVQFSLSMILTLIAALFILTFNVQAFEIPTGSMEPTLLIGDHLLVDRADMEQPQPHQSFWLLPHHAIKHRDILVFLSPAQPELHLVKRVIGVPGDHLHLENGIVIRNGEIVAEPYVIRNGSYSSYRDNFPAVLPNEDDGLTPQWQMELRSHVEHGEIVVPGGSYFVMGDNRDDSYDSRYWGFVPEQNIIGRPLLIYWSFNETAEEYRETRPTDRVAHAAKVVLHFFDETRWNRTLTIPH